MSAGHTRPFVRFPRENRRTTGSAAQDRRFQNAQAKKLQYVHQDAFAKIHALKSARQSRESRPAECHREPLAEPDMNLSAHPAPIN